MATFGGRGPWMPDRPIILQPASSDPESLLEDMAAQAEDFCPVPDRIHPEWTGIVNPESLPSNRFGGLEPQ